MRSIRLTQGVAAVVDDADYEWLVQWKWYAWFNFHTQSYYAVRNEKRSDGYRGKVWMHRLIMGIETGDPRTVDHRESGHTLDNRRENLRVCSDRENRLNSRPRRNRKTGSLKGADFKDGKWRARICVNWKQRVIGTFDSEEAAHLAYCQAAKEHFGEFARTK